MEATARTYRYLDAGRARDDPRRGGQGEGGGGEEMRRPEPSRRLGAGGSACARAGAPDAAAPTGRAAELDGAAEARGQAERRAAVARRRSSSRRPTRRSSSVEPFSTQKLTVALKQEARQPNSLLAAEINRRKEPLEAYPLDSMSMVGSVMRGGAALRAAARRQPALPGQAGRLHRPELRKDHEDLRDRNRIPRDRAGRRRRMDRAQQRPPASGEGAMKNRWGFSMTGWRSRAMAFALTMAAPWLAMAAERRSSRSTARSRPARKSSASSFPSRSPRCRPASRCRRRRASRSTCRASRTGSAVRRSTSTRATCVR